jgi:hypothetical protein
MVEDPFVDCAGSEIDATRERRAIAAESFIGGVRVGERSVPVA